MTEPLTLLRDLDFLEDSHEQQQLKEREEGELVEDEITANEVVEKTDDSPKTIVSPQDASNSPTTNEQLSMTTKDGGKVANQDPVSSTVSVNGEASLHSTTSEEL